MKFSDSFDIFFYHHHFIITFMPTWHLHWVGDFKLITWSRGLSPRQYLLSRLNLWLGAWGAQSIFCDGHAWALIWVCSLLPTIKWLLANSDLVGSWKNILLLCFLPWFFFLKGLCMMQYALVLCTVTLFLFFFWGVRSVSILVVGNRIGNQSSNRGWGCLHFILH